MKAEFHKISQESATISSKGASHPSSFCLSLHDPHPQLAQLPCHQLLGDAAVIAAQLQGPDADSGQLTTRPPNWRRHRLPPLLLQEKPVLQLAPHSVALSSSFHPHHTPQGVAGSCLWGGRLCHLLAASIWMAHPLHHHPRPHPLLLHSHLPLPHLRLQLRKSNKINFMLSIKCLKSRPIKTHWHDKLAIKLLQIGSHHGSPKLKL